MQICIDMHQEFPAVLQQMYAIIISFFKFAYVFKNNADNSASVMHTSVLFSLYLWKYIEAESISDINFNGHIYFEKLEQILSLTVSSPLLLCKTIKPDFYCLVYKCLRL